MLCASRIRNVSRTHHQSNGLYSDIIGFSPPETLRASSRLTFDVLWKDGLLADTKIPALYTLCWEVYFDSREVNVVLKWLK
jgi:hypothetical protein